MKLPAEAILEPKRPQPEAAQDCAEMRSGVFLSTAAAKARGAAIKENQR